MAEPARPDELPTVLELIIEQQADVGRRVAAVGIDAEGIAGELADFEPAWASTVRVVRDGGSIVGACGVEWDEELGRAWIVGPWVRAEDDAWQRTARDLVDAVMLEVPAGIDRFDLGIEAAADDLAVLADGLGWERGECNLVLVADHEVATGWAPDAPGAAIRPASIEDAPAIQPLHDDEFPETYASADRLVVEAVAGERTTLVATDAEGAVIGYASGEVHGDGEAYIDFLGVAPDARRTGAGAALVKVLALDLLDRAALGRVALTVQEHRVPARALYERLGFRSDGAIVGYRSR